MMFLTFESKIEFIFNFMILKSENQSTFQLCKLNANEIILHIFHLNLLPWVPKEPNFFLIAVRKIRKTKRKKP